MQNRIMKSIACIFLLLTAGIFFAAFSIREPNRPETAQSDTQMQLADITAQCAVWESRCGEENTLPVDIFRDLQRYVAKGECAEAFSAYRQEELICTVEELREVCPDYEKLVEEYFQTQSGENFLETDKIYRLEEAGGKSCFLMFYLHFDTYLGDGSFLSSMLLEEGDEGWQVTDTSCGGCSGIEAYEIFAREREGQKEYYLLKTYGAGGLELGKLSESFYVPVGGWIIEPIETGVKPEILFQETGSDLTVRIKEYVEENIWFLAWMEKNGKPIWGDEDEQSHYEMRKSADSAKSDAGIEQKWLIDFDGRKAIFRMAETEDGSLVLKAYAHEGNRDSALLFSCKIHFIQEAGVWRCTPAYWQAFDFNGLTARNTENVWLADKVQERVLREQQQRSIAPWQGEQFISEALFELLREEARAGLFGGKNSLLESYRLDLTEDMERFLQRAAETDWGNGVGLYAGDGECKWAFHWLDEDGIENFLSCINYNYAKDSIQWWKMNEGGLEEYAYVTEERELSQVICCDGQVYYITEAVPAYRGGDVVTAIVEIGKSDNWRSLCFFITTRASDVPDFTCVSLYEEKGLLPEVKEYVQERYDEILEACGEGRRGSHVYYGTEKERELTAEESRMLNSLSDGRRDLYANHHYFAADIDNDGIAEYAHAALGDYRDITFYEKEKGEFRVILFEEVLPIPDDAAALWQLWCEKLGDTTYLFTVEGLAYSPDYILRVRVLKDDRVADKAVYLLKAHMEEYCRDWDILEIRPSAEGVG